MNLHLTYFAKEENVEGDNLPIARKIKIGQVRARAKIRTDVNSPLAKPPPKL
ncbi:hypothetical protein [Pontibacter beigongshangensis]|uniref:hypothetical protein n=1 Tax=Pontibacter beigongshangensis TaxID=2574733 RepID=UPI00164FACE7|nr:hypothetical protein [Pontibacter beigongshangensis]